MNRIKGDLLYSLGQTHIHCLSKRITVCAFITSLHWTYICGLNIILAVEGLGSVSLCLLLLSPSLASVRVHACKRVKRRRSGRRPRVGRRPRTPEAPALAQLRLTNVAFSLSHIHAQSEPMRDVTKGSSVDTRSES